MIQIDGGCHSVHDFFGFNDQGFHTLLIFVSVCGDASHVAPDSVHNGYPLPPMLISMGMKHISITKEPEAIMII